MPKERNEGERGEREKRRIDENIERVTEARKREGKAGGGSAKCLMEGSLPLPTTSWRERRRRQAVVCLLSRRALGGTGKHKCHKAHTTAATSMLEAGGSRQSSSSLPRQHEHFHAMAMHHLTHLSQS